jgi:hypothetical protein
MAVVLAWVVVLVACSAGTSLAWEPRIRTKQWLFLFTSASTLLPDDLLLEAGALRFELGFLELALTA